MKHRLLEHRPVIDALEGSRHGLMRYTSPAMESETWMAAELLEHADEGALAPYLTQLIARLGRRQVASDVDTSLARILSRVGRPLLQQRGPTSRTSAGQAFGLELEGLSPEDQAFEVARHFARFATDAARRADRTKGHASAYLVARRAATAAALRLAPGLAPVSPRSHTLTDTSFFHRGRPMDALNP